MLKSNIFKTLAAVSFLCLPTLSTAKEAESFTFEASKPVTAYVTPTKKTTLLSIEKEASQGLLTFQTLGGGDLVRFTPGKQVQSSGRGLEIEFRSAGTLTFGVLTRASAPDEPAYLAHVALSEDGKVRITLTRTVLAIHQRPGENAVANKSVRGYQPSQWYRLRLDFQEAQSGATTLSAKLIEAGSGAVLLALEGNDAGEPLAAKGQVSFRFFSGSEKGGGKIQIRKVIVPE